MKRKDGRQSNNLCRYSIAIAISPPPPPQSLTQAHPEVEWWIKVFCCGKLFAFFIPRRLRPIFFSSFSLGFSYFYLSAEQTPNRKKNGNTCEYGVYFCVAHSPPGMWSSYSFSMCDRSRPASTTASSTLSVGRHGHGALYGQTPNYPSNGSTFGIPFAHKTTTIKFHFEWHCNRPDPCKSKMGHKPILSLESLAPTPQSTGGGGRRRRRRRRRRKRVLASVSVREWVRERERAVEWRTLWIWVAGWYGTQDTTASMVGRRMAADGGVSPTKE